MSAAGELLRLARKALQVALWRVRLEPARRAGRKLIVFELQLPAHWDYVDGVIRTLAASSDLVVLVTPLPEEQRRIESSPKRPHGVGVVPHELLKWLGRIDLYASLSQYGLGIPVTARTSVLIPHGLPSKGNTVIPAVFGFDHVFLTGRVHEEIFERRRHLSLPPGGRAPRLHRAGYPKSDRYFAISPPSDPKKRPVILFAPSYEHHTSLFTYGEALFERLLEVESAEVWVRLHPMLFHLDWVRRCGRDWPARLASRFANDLRVRLLGAETSDAVLEAADVLVTDVSGVAYEYLLLRRGPVVYLECPDFYRLTAPTLWDPAVSAELLGESVFVGRDFGIVTEAGGLVEAVRFALAHPDHLLEERLQLVERLVFNPGSGASTYVQLIRGLARADHGKRETQVPA